MGLYLFSSLRFESNLLGLDQGIQLQGEKEKVAPKITHRGSDIGP